MKNLIIAMVIFCVSQTNLMEPVYFELPEAIITKQEKIKPKNKKQSCQ